MGQLLALVALLSMVWVIYDVWAKQKSMTDTVKLLWTILAVIASVLTAVLYYFVVKEKQNH
jgi:riboflavin transporter FmnP